MPLGIIGGGAMYGKKSASVIAAAIAIGLTQVAIAADLPTRPVYKQAEIVPIGFSWTGCYVGLNLGGASDRHRYVTNGLDPTITAGEDAGRHTAATVTAGGQAGCDYQLGPMVVGFEGMADWADLNDSHFVQAPGVGVTLSSHTKWFATATGRIGYAIDRSLIYVKGGGAWIDLKESVAATGVTVDDGGRTRTGWTAGAGWEFSFMPNWSAKIEYNYMDFGSTATKVCASGACTPSGLNDKEYIHSVLLGVNYRF
jgi:outer membrane immunogenic protein